LPGLAADLAGRKVAVIAAFGNATARAATLPTLICFFADTLTFSRNLTNAAVIAAIGSYRVVALAP
jgi:hypothetical protein